MTIGVANTTLTNTFEYLVNRTNELADAMTTKVVTTESNTATGNAAITGVFSANVYIVGNSTVNTSISAPNTEQISSGVYSLNANGSWSRASVLANNGIIANSSGTFVNANTGIVANTSGVFVDSTYIATLTANNATRLGGVVAASYVQNTDSRTLSGNLIFSGANINFTGAELSVVEVTSGTWNGTTIATNKGGTGFTNYSNGQLLVGDTDSGSLVRARITPANNITVTNGGGSITIAADPDLSYVSAALSGTVDISGGGTSATIPAANSTVAGLITNGTQTIAGAKTFTSTPTISSTTPSLFFEETDSSNWSIRSSAGNFVFVNNATTTVLYVTQAGDVVADGNITAYSDTRLKENILTIDSALDKVSQMRGVYYNRIDDETKTRNIGVIAQEIEEVLPEVVHTREDDMKSVAYGNIVGLLIEAIKELSEEVKTLRSKLDV